MPILPRKKVEFAERVVPDHIRLAGAGLDQPGHDVEHRGLAAAGLAKDGNDLAFGDLERQFVNSDKIAASVRTTETSC